MNAIQIIAIVLLTMGAALTVICLVKMRSNKKFREKAIATTAEIFDVEKRTGHKSTYYLVKLRYTAVDSGVEYRGETVFSNKNKIKDTIPVWYKADDPSIFKTDTIKWLRWALIFSVLFFAILCWLCIWLLNVEYTYRTPLD